VPAAAALRALAQGAAAARLAAAAATRRMQADALQRREAEPVGQVATRTASSSALPPVLSHGGDERDWLDGHWLYV
jgi:hypothetical protein